jgi:hypothetical protein
MRRLPGQLLLVAQPGPAHGVARRPRYLLPAGATRNDTPASINTPKTTSSSTLSGNQFQCAEGEGRDAVSWRTCTLVPTQSRW